MLKGLFRIFNLINRRSTLCIGIWCIIVFERNNDKPFNLQTEPKKKKITNVENCEKTPTIKQFVYYFYTITKWQEKKKSFPPPPLVM